MPVLKESSSINKYLRDVIYLEIHRFDHKVHVGYWDVSEYL